MARPPGKSASPKSLAKPERKAERWWNIARAFGIRMTAIYEWRKLPGAPQDPDLAAWQAFYGANKEQLDRHRHGTPKESIPPITVEDHGLEVGAAATLQRLEQEEARAAAIWSRIQSDPKVSDAQRTAAHKRWLDLSESLRRYELAVTAEKRSAGELLPREECERALRASATHARLALVQALNQHIGVTAQRDAILRDAGALLARCLRRGADCQDDVPAWALAPMLSGWSVDR
jgi:hypothetical protein